MSSPASRSTLATSEVPERCIPQMMTCASCVAAVMARLSPNLVARAHHSTVRVLALIAAWNEERFIAGCLEHLCAHGVEAYLCDNDSTDRTVAIAERYLGRGLRGIERLPRNGTFRWRGVLQRKERLAQELAADW